MITDKDKIEQFKRDLKSYKFYEDSIADINLELLAINTKLEGLSSPAPKEVVAGASSVKFYRDNKLDLMFQEECLINKRKYMQDKLNEMDERLSQLSDDDSTMLKDIYINRKCYVDVADSVGMSESSLKRKINALVKAILIL